MDYAFQRWLTVHRFRFWWVDCSLPGNKSVLSERHNVPSFGGIIELIKPGGWKDPGLLGVVGCLMVLYVSRAGPCMIEVM